MSSGRYWMRLSWFLTTAASWSTPDQNDRGMQLLVRGGDQVSVVGFGHGPALALAPAVDAHPVEQAAPAAVPEAHQASHGHPCRRPRRVLRGRRQP
jgi:hypothetical protein